MFNSQSDRLGSVSLPEFSDTRVMMLPIILGSVESLPDNLQFWSETVDDLFKFCDPSHMGKVGYLTIDEKAVEPTKTHRRAGLHVDGVFRGMAGAWSGGGAWGSSTAGRHGMLTVASHVGCRAWNQDFDGRPGDEGECDHLSDQCGEPDIFGANEVFGVGGLCVHESIPMTETIKRQFVRLSMPSTAPWFEGYTVNEKGVMPTGPILTRREFM
jgi:hypothetical protein